MAPNLSVVIGLALVLSVSFLALAAPTVPAIKLATQLRCDAWDASCCLGEAVGNFVTCVTEGS
ncbi:MAG TPA: hypothetical protein VI565_09105 [Burkholderiales bacterium]|nr:hypothetical protein [Burkholderiales bacterium]